MKQVYINYIFWEDYLNGMYNDSKKDNEEYLIDKSIIVLSDSTLFYDQCNRVINIWPISTEVNLSNRNQNRRAWLGAAVCCIYCGAPEYITRIAWAKLSGKEKIQANNIANEFILRYEERNNGIHIKMGGPLLF